jgi:hypothetical protein
VYYENLVEKMIATMSSSMKVGIKLKGKVANKGIELGTTTERRS